jgi:hypothetical protein
MKYSLRSLMIVVTLVCVVLGGRVEYLRRWAEFHRREANRYADRVRARYAGYGETVNEEDLFEPKIDLLKSYKKNSKRPEERPQIRLSPKDADVREIYHNRSLEAAYRAALYRPWSIVRESK